MQQTENASTIIKVSLYGNVGTMAVTGSVHQNQQLPYMIHLSSSLTWIMLFKVQAQPNFTRAAQVQSQETAESTCFCADY